jgi:hypothetical protein
MQSLLEIETRFARAILHDDTAALATLIEPDGLDAATRLNVHRATVFVSLADVLMQTFPAVCRLVDARFFNYAAAVFIREQPPGSACLDEFGAAFPDFLAAFPSCAGLPYLGDVARLEWLLHRVARAPSPPPLAPAVLGHVPSDRYDDLVFAFAPDRAYLASAYPVARIWQANVLAQSDDAIIDWAAGGETLEIVRRADNDGIRVLDPATFAFRSRLAAGECLAIATEAALGLAESFDLGRAFAELFGEGCIISCRLAGPTV